MVYKVLLIIFIIIVIIAIYLKRKETKEKSLYERLNGIFGIAMVINKFSDDLIDDPIVGKNSKNKFLADWNNNKAPTRLQGLKFLRTLWLASISGGPFSYSGTRPGKCKYSLENAHKDLQISPEEFDAVAKVLSNTLDYYKIPEKEKNEVLSAFAAHKSEVNMGYFQANNMSSPKIKCPFGF